MLGGIFKLFQTAYEITVGNNISSTTVPNGRVMFASGGKVSSDSDLTFSTDTLSATNVSSSGLVSAGTGKFGGATSYSSFEADGTLVFTGDATTWDDIRIVPGSFDRPGSSDPSLQTWQPGGSGATYNVWCFNQSDYVIFSCQVPHNYKIGSTLYIHVHWTPHDRGTAEATKTVAWKVDLSLVDLDGVFPSSETIDLTDTCDGTNDKHQMTPDVAITATASKVSAMIIGKLYRDSGDTWVGTGANAPAILELDLHYEIDTPGSRQRLAK